MKEKTAKDNPEDAIELQNGEKAGEGSLERCAPAWVIILSDLGGKCAKLGFRLRMTKRLRGMKFVEEEK